MPSSIRTALRALLAGLVVTGLAVVLPAAPATATPVLSPTCEYLNSPSGDTTTIGAGEARQHALFSVATLNGGERIRLDFNAGGIGNRLQATFSIYDNEAEEYLIDTSTIAEGTDAHSFTYTVVDPNPHVMLLATFTMLEGTSTGTLTTLCYQPHDTDDDGVDDVFDNCLDVPNSNQKDTDQDGKGDLCDDEPLPGPADQTITFDQPADPVVRGPGVPLVGSTTSGLPVYYAVAPLHTGRCQVLNGMAFGLSAGPCQITAFQPGSPDFNPAPHVDRTVTVGKGAQTITFPQPADAVVGGEDVQLAATTSTGLGGIVYTSQTPGVCTIAFGRAHPVAAGVCTLAASQPGDDNYLPAAEVTRSLTVAAAPPTAQTIDFTQPGTTTVGGADVALVATASSGLPVAFTSLTPSTCTIVAGKAHPLAPGVCTIAADQPGNDAYLAAPRQTRILSITKGALLVTTTAETTWISEKPRHAYSSVVRSAATGQPVAGIVVTTNVPRSGSAAFGCTAITNALGMASCRSTDYYAVPTRRTYTATAKPSTNYLSATATAPLPSAF